MTRAPHLRGPHDAPVRRRRRAPLLVGTLGLVLLAGCTGGADAPSDAVATASAQAVASVDEVAAAQTEADALLRDVLAELRAGDETVRRLRAAASAASALDGAAQVRASLEDLDLADAEATFDRLDRAVGRARDDVAAATTAAVSADDDWSVAYLEAEARVLDAVADHAAAGRELVAAARPHRDALTDVLAVAEAIDVPDPDDGEAVAAAVELGVGDDLEVLIAAQEDTVAATERRAATAEALNAASADAAAIAERRPAS